MTWSWVLPPRGDSRPSARARRWLFYVILTLTVLGLVAGLLVLDEPA